MIIFDLGGCCSMSIAATTQIHELPLWLLLVLSAVGGAVFACGGALVFGRLLGGRMSGPGGGDNVTSAASRQEFVSEIETAWRAWQSRGEPFGLLLVDVDGFDNINQYYGREVGDRVLIEVAEQLRERAAGTGLAARIDADEFAIVCRGAAPEDLEALRNNLEAYVNFVQSVPVSLSIGIATPRRDDGCGLDLLVRARHSGRLRREARPVAAVDDALAALLDQR
jgi:diguanylate cyclase (GGDEF)-like protein